MQAAAVAFAVGYLVFNGILRWPAVGGRNESLGRPRLRELGCHRPFLEQVSEARRLKEAEPCVSGAGLTKPGLWTSLNNKDV